jgi:sugar phosphate isomerase/epimerase
LKKQNPQFDLFEPENFLKHCQELGAGGAQLNLGNLERSKALELRKFAEDSGLYLEAIVSAPKQKQDVERFDLEIYTALNAGAKAARTTIIPGRRYEFFSSLEMFNEYDGLARKSLELMAPVADRHKVPLAVENHKDHRDDERVALFKHISSEYVGACVDTGNSFALLEDPISTIEILAPWAHSVHLKDQALKPYEDGFLLADIPLGQGGLDLKRMVEILQKTKPGIRFSLELITRDPLKVPCLTDGYWKTFPSLPAQNLARTLRYVREHQTDNLQYISKMSPAEQLAREDANVRESLAFARNELGLGERPA